MKPIVVLPLIAAALFLAGCATTSSQPNPSSLQQATSLKEYIALKRGGETINYNVIAEREHQSIIEYRTYDEAMNVADARDIMMGTIDYEDVDEHSYALLKLGELLGVGKQTVFGLGEIKVEHQ